MDQRIIYKNPNGSACVIIPFLGSGLTIEQIAAKDVPSGAPYEIVDASEIPRDHGAALAQALAALKAARDAAIARGIEVDGLHVQTDDLSQSRLTAAALAAQLDPGATVRWKLATGDFVELTAPQIIALALAVRAHVQACFDREADLAAQIRAAADPAAVALTF